MTVYSTNFTTYIMTQILAISTAVLPLLEATRALVMWGRRHRGRRLKAKDVEGQGQGLSKSVDEHNFRRAAVPQADGATLGARRRATSF